MDYQAKIDKIEYKITQLEAQLESATGEERHDINQRIIALENKSTAYAQLLLPQNATAGNSHSILIFIALKYGYFHSLMSIDIVSLLNTSCIVHNLRCFVIWNQYCLNDELLKPNC